MHAFFTLLSSLGWFLVTLGLLVSFHEWGHFLAARAFRIEVLRFSVGFGKAVWERRLRSGMLLTVAWIPLGGYVRMLDTRQDEVPEGQRHRAYDQQRPWKRMVVAAAGPLANVVFALAAFWTMGVLGTPDFVPVIAAPTGVAQAAGFREGDTLTSVNGRPVRTWGEAVFALGTAVSAGNDGRISLIREGRPLLLTLPLADAGTHDRPLSDIGLSLKPVDTEAVIREVRAGLPAARAGLLPGDRLEAINGQPATSFLDFGELLQKEAARQSDVVISVRRQGNIQKIPLRAEQEERSGKPRWIIGVLGPDPHNALLRFGPLESVGFAWRTTVDTLSMTGQTLGRMLWGSASRDNLSGPVTIAQEAKQSADMGLSWFLRFLGLVSLSLAFMNLLPLPVLDGGHILIDAVEIVRGRPVPIRVLVAFQQTGIALLVALMSLALWNDMARLIG